MPDIQLNQVEFESLAAEILSAGQLLRFRAKGGSMSPFIRNGDIIEVLPDAGSPIRRGDVVLCRQLSGKLFAHRVIRTYQTGDSRRLIVQGDALSHPDGEIDSGQVLGRVITVEHNGKKLPVDTSGQRLFAQLWMTASPVSQKTYRLLVRMKDLLGIGGRL